MGSFAEPRIAPAGKLEFCEVRKNLKIFGLAARGIYNFIIICKTTKRSMVQLYICLSIRGIASEFKLA